MEQTYDQAIRETRREIRAGSDPAVLARLHRRSGPRHAAVALGVGLGMAFAAWVAFRRGDSPLLWVPASILLGCGIFALTVLLHEVVHGTVTQGHRPRLRQTLAWLYAVPSGLSPTQFATWHLDHHRWLGTRDRDPKRAHLSPKRNVRGLKLLYLTPALFPIYFRAAARAAAAYTERIRRRIRRERLVTIAFHLGVLGALVLFAGIGAALRVYVVPVFLVFPVAFTVNRLGQHYDVDAADPAHWGTLLRAGCLPVDLVFLWSNYHLEHHLFPHVPCYRLPALRRALNPFFRRRGIEPRTYTGLLRDWFLQNRVPHTDWRVPAAGEPAPAPAAGPES